MRRTKLQATILSKIGMMTLFAVGFSSAAQAGALYAVRVRDEHGQIVVKNLEIPLLKAEGIAETDHFKVVLHRADEAIALENTAEGERAATILYHLECAYGKMAEQVGEAPLAALGKVIIRLNTPNQFSEAVHFVREDAQAWYNNISAIPPSNDERIEKYPAWGYELWIRPVKTEKTETGMKSFDDQSKQVRSVMLEGTIAGSAAQYVQISSAYNSLANPTLHLQQLGVGLAISVGLPELFALVGRNVHKNVEFDAAMVPEVLYHEFAHLALAKWLPIGLSTPVLEGYANFFAVEISGLDQIAGKLGKYGKNFKGPKVKGTTRYQAAHENLDYSWEGFTPQLLLRVRDEFGPVLGTQIVTRSVLLLAHSKTPLENMTIKYDLCSQLKQAVQVLSSADQALLNQLKINRVFKAFGLTPKLNE